MDSFYSLIIYECSKHGLLSYGRKKYARLAKFVFWISQRLITQSYFEICSYSHSINFFHFFCLGLQRIRHRNGKSDKSRTIASSSSHDRYSRPFNQIFSHWISKQSVTNRILLLINANNYNTWINIIYILKMHAP